MRPPGVSCFVRCRNEAEYIVASLASVHRFADEILLALNRSEDATRSLVEAMIPRYPKIRIVTYDEDCAPIGRGYHEAVMRDDRRSLARFYNWCVEQTTFSHVCKWDGDMIALPTFGRVRELAMAHDVVTFDGYDVLGMRTTDYEARVFRHDMARARYVDWDLYEVLEHSYSDNIRVEEKCYLHMKLVKQDWLHRDWINPNDLAERSAPFTGSTPGGAANRMRRLASRVGSTMSRVVKRNA